MSNPFDYGAVNALFGPFGTDAEKKVAAWANARVTANPEWRHDCDGRLMAWSEYGRYSDLLTNLRARHWRGNSAAGGLLGGVLGSSGGFGNLGGLGRK
jgi:hypothetical protein